MNENKSYELILRIDNVNKNGSMYNLSSTLTNLKEINIKVTEEQLKKLTIGDVYLVKINEVFNGVRTQLIVEDFTSIFSLELNDEVEKALRVFYKCADESLLNLKKEFNDYLKSIKNKTLFEITSKMVEKYEKDFFFYPAGKAIHHAYVGGLLFHTVSMLRLGSSVLNIYKGLDLNYLYSGIILHDLLKTVELTNAVEAEYSLRGQLLGHIVLVVETLDKVVNELNYENTEEALILKHILLSHHGQLEFGSPKKPATLEALVISLLDHFDAKVRTVEEEVIKIEEETFSQGLKVLDRARVYKPKRT